MVTVIDSKMRQGARSGNLFDGSGVSYQTSIERSE